MGKFIEDKNGDNCDDSISHIENTFNVHPPVGQISGISEKKDPMVGRVYVQDISEPPTQVFDGK